MERKPRFGYLSSFLGTELPVMTLQLEEMVEESVHEECCKFVPLSFTEGIKYR